MLHTPSSLALFLALLSGHHELCRFAPSTIPFCYDVSALETANHGLNSNYKVMVKLLETSAQNTTPNSHTYHKMPTLQLT